MSAPSQSDTQRSCLEETASLRLLDPGYDGASVYGEDQHLRAVAAMVRLLAQARVLDDVLVPLLRLVCDYTGCDVGACWMQATGSNGLRCHGYYQTAHVPSPNLRVVTHERIIAVGDTLVGRTWQYDRPEWHLDLASDASFARILVAWQCGLRWAFALPVHVHGVVRAVLECYSCAAGHVSPEQRTVLELITMQLGVFLAQLEAQQALSVMAEQTTGILATAPILLLEVNDAGVITQSEGQALQALGQMPGEAVGCSIDAVYSESQVLTAMLRRALSGCAVAAHIVLRGVGLEMHCLPQFAAGGVVGVRIIGTICARSSSSRQREVGYSWHHG